MNKRCWVFGDYAQAEAMVVAWRGPVPLLKQWFRAGEDVHLNVAKLIGKTVQANKLKLPNGLFGNKPWQEFTKSDPERQIGKSGVHSGSYGVGSDKWALVTGLPEPIAKLILEIYYKLFPEIKSGYQAYIDSCLAKDSTIITPLGRRHTFYDHPSPDRSRSAYSLYAQCTVGDLLSICLDRINRCFNNLDDVEGPITPLAIAKCGLDTALQEHDAVGVRCFENEVDNVCSIIHKASQIPMEMAGDTLVIPMEFKVGPSWGELKDYHYNES